MRSLDFRGNHAFSDAELANAVVTTPSSRLERVWGLRSLFGIRRCIARRDLILDRARLVVYYRKRGYADVAVDTVVHDAGHDRIDVAFDIKEGRPTVITALTFQGLQDVADSGRILRNLPVRRGGPFDQYAIEVARDSIRRRLTNVGYPFTEVLVNSDVQRSDSVPALAGGAPSAGDGEGGAPAGGRDGAAAAITQRTAQVEFNIIPGALVHLGEVAVQVQPREGTKQQIPSDVVRDIIGLKPGRLYRQDELERATRNLYQTDAYQHVKIEFVADSTRPDGDSTVGVNVQLVERYMRSARLDAGFGTLDCFRTQGAYVNRNFLHSARRLELTGRLSKIGVGAPLDSKSIRDLLCRQAKRDPYSDTLNYYAGATIRQPTLFGLRTVPDLTVYSELRSEYKAYRRVTPVGLIASLTRERFFRTPITYAYELSYGRTEASPALFCSVLNRCDPADRASFEELRRSGVLSLLVNRDRTDNPLNPTRGYYARFNFRTAHPWLLSDTAFQFNKVVGDLSRYWRVSGWSVLAARLELGTVIGKLNRTLPPQERLYGGGPNTVRGFRQNELGPSVYIVPYSDSTLIVRFDSVTMAGDSAFTLSVPATTKPQRVVPTGGNSVAVANVELRVRSPYFPNLVQFTLFTDVGEVWNRSASEPTLRFEALKVTPGLGFRVFSPVGAIRLDLGYNRYSPPPGAAYATGPEAGGSQLLCVSPGNSVAATRDSATQQFTQGSYTSCNGALDPPREPNFFKRITFFFAIGQAF